MNAILSKHSKEQAIKRVSGLVSEQEILGKVSAVAEQVKSTREWQAMVIVKRLPAVVRRGKSSGNMVVACVEPSTMVVKTVMLRFDWQRSDNGQIIE